jgi:hypothetical protein
VGLQAALALAGLVLIAGVPARAPAGNPTRSLAATVRAGLVQLSRTPVLRGVTLTTTVAMGAQGLLALAFPFFAAELGAGRGAAGYLWAAFVLGSAAGGPLVSRLGARPVLALVGAAQLAAVTAGWLAGLRLTTAAR